MALFCKIDCNSFNSYVQLWAANIIAAITLFCFSYLQNKWQILIAYWTTTWIARAKPSSAIILCSMICRKLLCNLNSHVHYKQRILEQQLIYFDFNICNLSGIFWLIILQQHDWQKLIRADLSF
jgi:hypothetical protein